MNAAERAELIACMEAGTAAFLAGADHGDNPHLEPLRRGVEPPESRMAMERLSAWWDGYEETYLAMTPKRVFGDAVYF